MKKWVVFIFVLVVVAGWYVSVEKQELMQHSVTKEVPLSKPTYFESDVDARAAYRLCRRQQKILQACIDALGQHYQVSGFELYDGDRPALGYLTLPLPDGAAISVQYEDGSVLLGDYKQLVEAARTGQLPESITALLTLEARQLRPNP